MDAFIGEIRAFCFDYVPQNFASCDGTEISSKNSLFSLWQSIIGNYWGGDGVSTIKLPKLEDGIVMAHAGVSPVSGNTWTLGQKAGNVKSTITAVPSHSHKIEAFTQLTGIATTPSAGCYLNRSYQQFVYAAGCEPNVEMNPQMLGSVGAATPQPHDNVQPTLRLRVCIAMTGEYPPHPD